MWLTWGHGQAVSRTSMRGGGYHCGRDPRLAHCAHQASATTSQKTALMLACSNAPGSGHHGGQRVNDGLQGLPGLDVGDGPEMPLQRAEELDVILRLGVWMRVGQAKCPVRSHVSPVIKITPVMCDLCGWVFTYLEVTSHCRIRCRIRCNPGIRRAW